MTIMVPQSGIPWIDPCGDPYAGAKAYFYLAGTTTPKTVYTGADKDIPHDHPVIANGSGMFPAVFVDGAEYRLRIETASGETIWDVDGISVPQISTGGGGGGDTPVEFLFQTGDYKYRHGTGTLPGFVRANGRTIGSASSGATERANTDCQALFEFLWTQDPTLPVSGGRGGNATSDWAANKTITLPDARLITHIGMADMGNTASEIIPDDMFDNGEDGTVLGATVGAAAVTLVLGQIPNHNHPGSVTTSAGLHSHTYPTAAGGSGNAYGGGVQGTTNGSTSSAGAHSHGVNVAAQGGGEAHPNVQPSMVITKYLKL